MQNVELLKLVLDELKEEKTAVERKINRSERSLFLGYFMVVIGLATLSLPGILMLVIGVGIIVAQQILNRQIQKEAESIDQKIKGLRKDIKKNLLNATNAKPPIIKMN